MHRLVTIIRRLLGFPRPSSYINASKTVSAAEQAGLSVGEYVEQMWDKTGDTARTVDAIEDTGILARDNLRIVEIGPGTGRYLDLIYRRCTPAQYDIYETAMDWRDWLTATYPVISHATDGRTLAATPNRSIDLAQAHGVFVYTPTTVTYQYWCEIVRVMRVDGVIVFDVIDESCITPTLMTKWIDARDDYLRVLPLAYVIDFFAQHYFTLTHDYTQRYGAGLSRYLIFQGSQSS